MLASQQSTGPVYLPVLNCLAGSQYYNDHTKLMCMFGYVLIEHDVCFTGCERVTNFMCCAYLSAGNRMHMSSHIN